jgi:hypothetical protein
VRGQTEEDGENRCSCNFGGLNSAAGVVAAAQKGTTWESSDKEFSPRQKVGSFNLGRVLEQLLEAISENR